MVDASNKNKCPAGMALIPASKFMMGADNFWETSASPRHEVEVSALCLDINSVTNRERNAQLAKSENRGKFKLVATECGNLTQSVVAKGDDAKRLYESTRSRAGQCGLHVELNNEASVANNSPEGFNGPDQPAVNVTWKEADDYCKAQGKRLPTEAEREKAAIGPSKGYDLSIQYGTASGKLSHKEAVYDQRTTANVGSKLANGYGLHDMTGNVWEWTNDWYSADYYKNSPAKDPQGPANDTGTKVLRGGSWVNYYSVRLRAAFRGSDDPGFRYDFVGFRCAVSVLPEDSKK